MLVSSWLSGRILDWRFSQPSFDPSFGNLACLATLKSSDWTTQSVCGWQYIYIYLYGMLHDTCMASSRTYIYICVYIYIYIKKKFLSWSRKLSVRPTVNSTKVRTTLSSHALLRFFGFFLLQLLNGMVFIWKKKERKKTSKERDDLKIL